jgi:hypothetical protein
VEKGGITPDKGAHSTIERPEPVKRVTPPKMTINKSATKKKAKKTNSFLFFFILFKTKSPFLFLKN